MKIEFDKNGFLIAPKMTIEERDNIANPKNGIIVESSDGSTHYLFNDGEWKNLKLHNLPEEH